MPVYIKTYDLSKVNYIPDDTYRWCYRNNFSSGLKADLGHQTSSIRDCLGACVVESRGILIVAHDGQRHLGWGLTYRCEDLYGRPWQFQVYIPPKNRRHGIGSKILAKACSKVGRVTVYAHEVSDKFYNANGLTKNDAISGKKLKSK